MMVRMPGFEPGTFWSVARCSIQLSYIRLVRILRQFWFSKAVRGPLQEAINLPESPRTRNLFVVLGDVLIEIRLHQVCNSYGQIISYDNHLALSEKTPIYHNLHWLTGVLGGFNY